MNIVSVISDIWERRKKTIRGAAIGLGVLFGLFLIIEVFFYSSSAFFPKACTVCHYENLAYNTWKGSTHKNVSCSQCHHYRPGLYSSFIAKYWSGFYSGHPYVDVKDESCFSCHGKEILNDTLTFKNNVHFLHADHYNRVNRTVELRCSSCHTALEGGGHMQVSEETCFLCHFKGVKRGQAYTGCPSCHGTPKEIIQHGGFVFSHESYLRVGVTCDQCHINVAKGTGEVPRRICRDCHVERMKEYSNAFKVHEIHVGKLDLRCNRCHTEIQHGDIQLVETLEVRCENCHGTSHSNQKEMYMGTGGKGIPNVPSRMFAAQVSCEGCHPRMTAEHPMTPKQELQAKRQACVRCHGKGFDRMLDDWLKVMNRLTREVKPIIDQAQRTVKHINPANPKAAQLKSLLEDAIFDYRFVVNGRGAHNIDYAVRLLKKSVSNVQEALAELGRSAPVVADPVLTTPDGYCMAFCHHIVKPPERVTFERIDFPHKMHVEEVGLECTVCHSPDKHGLRVITKSECMNCHHGQQDLACSTCHVEQQELYTGKIKELHVQGDADVMAQAEVGCDGCHDVSQTGEVLTLVAEACVNCHEEGYDEMVREWHNDLQDEMAEVTALVTKANEKIRSGEISGKAAVELRKRIRKAQGLLRFLDKAKPAHNRALSEDLLSKAKESLQQFL